MRDGFAKWDSRLRGMERFGEMVDQRNKKLQLDGMIRRAGYW
jgi:hypothetical protein